MLEDGGPSTRTNTNATGALLSRCCQVGPDRISRISGLSSYST
jgi:hypothetical protein